MKSTIFSIICGIALSLTSCSSSKQGQTGADSLGADTTRTDTATSTRPDTAMTKDTSSTGKTTPRP